MSGVARAGAEVGRPRTPSPLPVRFTRLRRGDRVAVVSPSGVVDPGRVEAGCAALRELGLDVVVGKHALDRAGLAGGTPREGWYRLAGTDADRAADLQHAWCDPSVRAVICARGGYGATRVLPLLDWDALAAAGPKLLHGFSDVTALHLAFGRRLGVTTTFGPMLGALGGAAEYSADDRALALAGLRSVLFGTAERLVITGDRALRPGRAEGPLTGGTLALIAAMLGTPDAPLPAEGRVVFLEDIGEEPYRVDRMLTQLLQAGWFDGAAGIVLGSWTDCGDPAELDTVFEARLGSLGVPILAGLAAGHGPRQHTLEMGAPVRLDAAARTLEPAPGGAR
ncbi:S66 peptidase family protein [Spirillospora sp. CA-294931]|uniref:S66 peptidase family protein n=1 Tax=Spirillospora sp. CA-294931 TaxID=3240042 RepID=UPI003D8CF13E